MNADCQTGRRGRGTEYRLETVLSTVKKIIVKNINEMQWSKIIHFQGISVFLEIPIEECTLLASK